MKNPQNLLELLALYRIQFPTKSSLEFGCLKPQLNKTGILGIWRIPL